MSCRFLAVWSAIFSHKVADNRGVAQTGVSCEHVSKFALLRRLYEPWFSP